MRELTQKTSTREHSELRCAQHDMALMPGETYHFGDRQFSAPPTCPQCDKATREGYRAQLEKDARAQFRLCQSQADVPRRYRAASLENLIVDTPAQREIQAVGRGFVESNGRTPSGLIVIGTLGSGKTHFACALANAFLMAKQSVCYMTALGLIRKLRSTWGSREESEEQAFRRLVRTHLLVVDEVGATTGTANEQATLGNLLDARYADRRPTVVIGNLTIVELTYTLGERILDRCKQGGKVLVFDWASRRPTMPHDDGDDDEPAPRLPVA